MPALSARVIDQTATLGPGETAALAARLAGFESETGAQVVVLIVPTTAPEDIAAYAQRVGDTWKIGRRGVGDGLLLVVAKDDRTVRIEVAKALEGAVQGLFGLALPAQDHEIVGVGHDPAAKAFLQPELPPPQHEPAHVQIGQPRSHP